MKKILIASLCIFTLCFTACASKESPENQIHPEAPVEDISEENNITEESEENLEEKNSTQEENQNEISSEVSQEDLEETSEEYPEPEEIQEPEIITLEPEEESIIEESETPEEVEKEEPPLIETTIDSQVSIPEVQAENEQQTEAKASEDDEVSDVTDVANITADTDITDVSESSDSDTDEVTSLEGGIDITDEESNDNSDDVKIQVITPSRSVTLKKFEYLDITYPGSGWIYMGLTDDSKDLAYFGRKLGTKDTKFTLQARNSGTKIVHFYKNDPLSGRYLDDYLEVIILAETGSNKNHIEAPEYKLPVQKKEIPEPVEVTESTDKIEESKEEKTIEEAAEKKALPKKEPQAETSKENQKEEETAPIQAAPISDSSTLLQEAQVLYNEKEYAAALAKINQFFEFAQNKRDEGFYLKGQILEAKSEVRDIKGAIDSYTSLTKNYPASKLWDNANKRIIYLKRFYLEVR